MNVAELKLFLYSLNQVKDKPYFKNRGICDNVAYYATLQGLYYYAIHKAMVNELKPFRHKGTLYPVEGTRFWYKFNFLKWSSFTPWGRKRRKILNEIIKSVESKIQKGIDNV